jgi:flagellar hook-associated protein FlgK
MSLMLSSTAASGMQAAQARLGVSAHNVANMNTPGFQRLNLAQQALPAPSAGVQTQVTRADTPGVALENEAVEQIAATYAFKANAQVLRTSQSMMGSLLDVYA